MCMLCIRTGEPPAHPPIHLPTHPECALTATASDLDLDYEVGPSTAVATEDAEGEINRRRAVRGEAWWARGSR